MSDLNHHLPAIYIVSNLRRFYFLWEHLVYITGTEEVYINKVAYAFRTATFPYSRPSQYIYVIYIIRE